LAVSFGYFQLKSLGEEGMIRELVQYLHVAENLFIFSNPSLGTDMYNIVLHYLVEAQEVSDLDIIASLF
jgi:hypothetical protein